MSYPSNSTTTVGFGTAGLGSNCYYVVQMALEAGFRRFDTAEADYWYDQQATGRALRDFFQNSLPNVTCRDQQLAVSTKIPPWRLTSVDDMRRHARNSRQELAGFCDNLQHIEVDDQGYVAMSTVTTAYPLDVYYIHAPTCWKGWHPRCDDPPPTMPLREAWNAMEYIAGVDQTARRIGLSNVRPDELRDIIRFVREREGQVDPPPRLPDVLQIYADPIQSAEELRKICADHSIEFVSYSTLGTQHRGSSGNPVLDHPTVQHLAARYRRSTAEVVLSWAIQRGMSVIPRSSKRHHIEELARLLDPWPGFLSDEDLAQIDKMQGSA